ncbi:MAG: hypothetical protein RR766_03550 [Longicatena sp.]|uniref:hypothetical protein n=1 Tax=Anaerorhabdus sp. TaxID=1872524 RepID=UPI002FC9C574
MFYPCFILFWVCLIYIWIFDKERFNKDYSALLNFFVEPDYSFYLEHLDKDIKKEIHKRIKLTIVFFSLLTFLFIDKLSIKLLLVNILISIMVYKLQYVLCKKKYEKTLMEADSRFPYYLNNLCILIQSNAVPIALLKSLDSAPEIFKKDIEELVQDLHIGDKKGLVPYLDFYCKFPQVKDLNRVVKTLYNISIASSQKNKMILSLTKLTNEKVNHARQDKFDKVLDTQALIPWISFIWVGIVLITSFSAINIGDILS